MTAIILALLLAQNSHSSVGARVVCVCGKQADGKCVKRDPATGSCPVPVQPTLDPSGNGTVNY